MYRVFAEDEVLPNCHENSSISSIHFAVDLQTREAASVSWNARVLPTELHRSVCMCTFLRVCRVSV